MASTRSGQLGAVLPTAQVTNSMAATAVHWVIVCMIGTVAVVAAMATIAIVDVRAGLARRAGIGGWWWR